MGKSKRSKSDPKAQAPRAAMDMTAQLKAQVEQLLASLGDRPLYMGTILNSSLESRVLGIGRFRIIMVKVDKKGRVEINGDGHIYDLKKLTVEHSRLLFEFSQVVLTMVDVPPMQLRQIFQCVITNYSLVTFGWPESAQFMLNLVNPPVSLETKRPSPEFGGYRESYAAFTNMVMKPASRDLLEYIGYCFDRELVLSHVLDVYSDAYDFGAFVAPLKFNTYFTRVELENCERPQIGEGFARVASFNRSMQSLKLIQCGLNASHMDLLRKAVENNRLTKLCEFDFSRNMLSDIGFQSLANILQMLPIRALHLEGCGAGPKGVESLLQGLIHNPRITKSLRVLNLSGNKFGSSCSNTLAGFLSLARKSNSDKHTPWALTELKIAECAVNCAPLLIELYNSMSYFDNLEVLNISGNDFDDQNATNLAKMVKNSRTLHELHVSKTGIKPLSVAHLMQSFLKNGGVKTFSISCSHIPHTETSVRDLLPIVQASAKEKLRELKMHNCSLGNAGVLELLGNLSGAKSLETLVIGANYKYQKKAAQQVGTEIGRRVMQIPNLKVLRVIGKDDRYLGPQGSVALLGQIVKHPTLVELDITHNNIGNDGMNALAQFLTTSKLRKLRFDNNSPKKDGLEAIGRAILGTKTLLESDLPKNDSSILGKKGPAYLLQLAEYLSKNNRVYLMHVKKKKEDEERAKRNKPNPIPQPVVQKPKEPVPVEPIPLQKNEAPQKKEPIIINQGAAQQQAQPNINITIQAPPGFMQQGSSPNVMNMFPQGMLQNLQGQGWKPKAQRSHSDLTALANKQKVESSPVLKPPEVIQEPKSKLQNNPMSQSTVAFFKPEDILSDDEEDMNVVNMMNEMDQSEAQQISQQFEPMKLDIASDDDMLSD